MNSCVKSLAVLLLLSVAIALGLDDASASIKSTIVVRPKSMSVDFWTPERMRAAKEPIVVPPHNNANTGRSAPVSVGPEFTVPGRTPDASSPLARALNVNGRHVATNGRVFWSCGSGLSSCSAGVIPSTSGDVIVTAGHCVFDTSTLSWLTNCNWIFVPAYANGSAPYGRWPARQSAVLNSWASRNPNYNYDTGFVALSQLNGKHITQLTGSEGLGFNLPRGRLSYAFGYPVNLANGQFLQLCSGTPTASKYTANNYVGQGLSNCRMTGGCSGGPWMQQFNESTGIGVTYSVNSFTYTLAPNTMNGPVFDSNTQALWNYITAR